MQTLRGIAGICALGLAMAGALAGAPPNGMPAFGEVLRSDGGGLKALMFPRPVTGVPHGQLPSRMAAPHWRVAQGLMLSRWTESEIHRAILQGRSDILSQLLVRGGSCNLRHPSGWSPLQLALHCGNREALRILIAHGADPRERGPGGETSLGLALALNSTPVELEILLKAGPNPNLPGPGGRPAISALLQVRDLERAEVILRHGGVAGPALYNAIVEGDRELLRFLLQHGVKPDEGSTDALMVAAVRGGRRGLVEDILEAGNLSDEELKGRGREGQGPLHLAVLKDLLAALEFELLTVQLLLFGDLLLGELLLTKLDRPLVQDGILLGLGHALEVVRFHAMGRKHRNLGSLVLRQPVESRPVLDLDILLLLVDLLCDLLALALLLREDDVDVADVVIVLLALEGVLLLRFL